MSAQLQVTGEAKIRDIQGPVVANSGVITALDGAASQYVRGDGTLADFPTSSGGGSSVSYYLNSSVSQGTIGGVAYRELSKDPIIGAGTDIAISSNGYVANYITDVNDPDVVLVPGGNFNCEFYFSVNNNTGNPTTYAELYKYDGTTFTLLGTSSGVPESINQGTTIAPYYFAIPVATAALSVTDRLAIRIYVNVDGRTVTLHTENGHLCQVVTTLSKGMVSLNNLTDQSQYLATGTSGTNFAIVSSGDTHTFNLPTASATNTGKLSSTDWSTFNNKQNALTNPITGTGASGQVTFFNGTTSVIGSNNFFWDNTNSFLGVGTNVPSAGVTSFSTTPAFQFKAAGTAPAITFSNTLTSASLACVFGLATANNQFITGTAAGDMAIANQSTSAGAIVFGTGTTERMRMTSAGTLSIGNTNSTYKLDVTGIVRFTGELTGSSAVFSSTVRPASSFTSDLGTSSFRWNDIYGFSLTLTSSVTALSLIKSGGTSSQFLMADGSVNTSVLPSGAYLPLTGGTLTGALTGTSATFSGNGLFGGATAFAGLAGGISVNGSTNSGINFRVADVLRGYAYVTNTGNIILESTNGSVILAPNGSPSLTIASTGAATFSGGLLTVNVATDNTTVGIFHAGGGTANRGLKISTFVNVNDNAGVRLDAQTTAGGATLALATAGVDRLTIASTGAATFSSSLSVPTATISSSITSPMFRVTPTGTFRVNTDGDAILGYMLRSGSWKGNAENNLAFATDGAYGISFFTNGSASEKMIITSGGNVLINGTTVQNSATSRGNLTINGTTSILNLSISDTNGGYLFHGGTDMLLVNAKNGAQLFYTNDTERMRITSGGNVLIGTTSTALLGLATIQYGTNSTSNPTLLVRNGGGSAAFVSFSDSDAATTLFGWIVRSGSGVNYASASDYRLKQDLKEYEGLSLISKIKTYDYEWKSDNSRSYGVIAHELQEVIPYAVTGEKDGENMQGVDYSKIVPVLIKAIQELKQEIEILKNK